MILFRDALQAIYGPLDWLPEPDSQLHRFHVPGDHSGSRNGWYVLFPDGLAAGAFGSWKAGAVHHWSSRTPADPREAEQVRQRIEQARRQRRPSSAAAGPLPKLGRPLLAGSSPCRSRPPVSGRQGVKPHGLRQRGDELLVPLFHAARLVNLQRIAPDGGKRFLSGGRVTGCYSTLGQVEAGQPLYFCEGWATGATIHEHTGAAVACALNAGNLLAVGQHLRRRYPDAVLIVAGDDDRQTEAEGKGNPGRDAANRAAVALGCDVVLPVWPAAAPLHLSDFNDLATWRAAHEPA
ncbi:toprim domain-containing protein [Azotobacter sp. CWF10]